MFEMLEPQPADALLALIGAFRADQRTHKIDLGVGVYRDARGVTPVMRAVKAAEQMLHETQASKSYLGPEGDLGFVSLLRPYVFGEADGFGERLLGLQTPGGTGALRLGAEIIRAAHPGATVWLGTPTWPNHAPIFHAAGLALQTYKFADLATQTVDFESMRGALARAKAGDVVLLHACCHNPTGIDFSREQWKEIAATVATRRLIPFVDLAYQGLGDGLDEDAAAMRLVVGSVEEALIAYSCDKNFGLYRDRVGALYALTRGAEVEANNLMSNLTAHARVNWSMPPDHGAALVRMILERPELVSQWRAELDEMRGRINENRAILAAADPALSFIRDQRGLFSNLAMSKPQAQAMRARHAIYMPDSGRLNMAGMQPRDASAIVAALKAEGWPEALAA